MNILSWIEEHEALAAWVQAIGTLLALWTAIWTTGQAARISARPALRFTSDVVKLCDRIYLDLASSPIVTEFWSDVSQDFASEAREALDHHLGAPIAAWPAPDLYFAAREFRDCADDLGRTLGALNDADKQAASIELLKEIRSQQFHITLALDDVEDSAKAVERSLGLQRVPFHWFFRRAKRAWNYAMSEKSWGEIIEIPGRSENGGSGDPSSR